MKKLTHLWNNRKKIADGFLNYIRKRDAVESVAQERLKICRSNKCGYYDKDGTSEAAYIPNVEACSICGCMLQTLTRSMDSVCSLEDLKKEPLWKQVNIQDDNI